jgi:hypothetical protein
LGYNNSDQRNQETAKKTREQNQMTALNRTGETVRGFEVFVPRKGRKTLVYGRGQTSTPLTGQEAISCMETLTQRGFEPMARTDGYAEEWLTLNEMREVFNVPASV